jgi:hypothetical protein
VGLLSYIDQLEPENQEAEIWRFMEFDRFKDLITTGELYFCRSDRFTNDLREGLPPEEVLAMLGLHPLDINDRRQLAGYMGTLAQNRESFYVSCWHLFREETLRMWQEYGERGVAISSRYSLLKASLSKFSDNAYIGLVRYGAKHLVRRQLEGSGWNLFRLITSKRVEYAHEREVRAFLWLPQYLGDDRHIDDQNRVHPYPLTPPPPHVPDGLKRKVDLQALLTKIVISPWASPTTVAEVNRLVTDNAPGVAIQKSELTSHLELLPEGRKRFV